MAARHAAGQPAYVKEALRSLTPMQRKYVLDGSLHGDATITTYRALKRKGLFYLKITSPNGQCGHAELTPLGETVREILKARAAKAQPDYESMIMVGG
jgi:hypothetical protein